MNNNDKINNNEEIVLDLEVYYRTDRDIEEVDRIVKKVLKNNEVHFETVYLSEKEEDQKEEKHEEEIELDLTLEDLIEYEKSIVEEELTNQELYKIKRHMQHLERLKELNKSSKDYKETNKQTKQPEVELKEILKNNSNLSDYKIATEYQYQFNNIYNDMKFRKISSEEEDLLFTAKLKVIHEFCRRFVHCQSFELSIHNKNYKEYKKYLKKLLKLTKEKTREYHEETFLDFKERFNKQNLSVKINTK